MIPKPMLRYPARRSEPCSSGAIVDGMSCQKAQCKEVSGQHKMKNDRDAAGRPEAAFRMQSAADEIADHHPAGINCTCHDEKPAQPRVRRSEKSAPPCDVQVNPQ